MPPETAFASGASFFISPPTSASVVAGAGELEVVGDLLRVGRLPVLDALDDDQPALAREEAERVARGDRVRAGELGRGVDLDRVGREPAAEPVDGAVDLRAVGAGDQIGGLELVRHRRQA